MVAKIAYSGEIEVHTSTLSIPSNTSILDIMLLLLLLLCNYFGTSQNHIVFIYISAIIKFYLLFNKKEFVKDLWMLYSKKYFT